MFVQWCLNVTELHFCHMPRKASPSIYSKLIWGDSFLGGRSTLARTWNEGGLTNNDGIPTGLEGVLQGLPEHGISLWVQVLPIPLTRVRKKVRETLALQLKGNLLVVPL